MTSVETLPVSSATIALASPIVNNKAISSASTWRNSSFYIPLRAFSSPKKVLLTPNECSSTVLYEKAI